MSDTRARNAAYSKRYYEAHREEVLARQKRYRSTDAYRASHRAYAASRRRAGLVDKRGTSQTGGYYWAHRAERLAYAADYHKRVGRHTSSHEVRLLGERVDLNTMPPEVRELGLLLKKARQIIQVSRTGALTP